MKRNISSAEEEGRLPVRFVSLIAAHCTSRWGRRNDCASARNSQVSSQKQIKKQISNTDFLLYKEVFEQSSQKHFKAYVIYIGYTHKMIRFPWRSPRPVD